MTPPDPILLSLVGTVGFLAKALHGSYTRRRTVASEYYRRAEDLLRRELCGVERDPKTGEWTKTDPAGTLRADVDALRRQVEELKSRPWKMAPMSENGTRQKEKP